MQPKMVTILHIQITFCTSRVFCRPVGFSSDHLFSLKFSKSASKCKILNSLKFCLNCCSKNRTQENKLYSTWRVTTWQDLKSSLKICPIWLQPFLVKKELWIPVLRSLPKIKIFNRICSKKWKKKRMMHNKSYYSKSKHWTSNWICK